MSLQIITGLWIFENTSFNGIDGDSTGRAITLLQNYHRGFLLWYSNIWPPAYFQIYTLPLKLFDNSLSVLRMTQLFLSSINILLAWSLFKKYFNQDSLALCLLLIGLVYYKESVLLVHIVLSNTMFLTFILLTFISYRAEAYKKKYLILPAFFIGTACSIRFEGYIFLFCLTLFDLYRFKSFSRISIILIPVIILTFIYEYQQYLHGQPFLYGLLSNTSESLTTNQRIGTGTIDMRFKKIYSIIHGNLWFFYFLLPFALYKFYKNEKQNPTSLLLFLSFCFYSIVFIFSSIKGHIAVFSRYWFIHFYFSLFFIIYFFNVLKYPKVIKTVLTLSLILTLAIKGISFLSFLDKRQNTEMNGIIQYIQNSNNLEALFLDDNNSRYIFNDILLNVFQKTRKKDFLLTTIEYNVNRVHRNYDLNNNLDLFNKFINKAITKNSLIVLVKSSPLHKAFISKRLQYNGFTIVYENEKFMILENKKNHFSH